jgi:hypothetical protein
MPPHPPSPTPFCRSRDHTHNRSIQTAGWCCIQHRIPVPFSPQSTTACSYGPDEALHRAVLEAMKRNSNNNNNNSSSFRSSPVRRSSSPRALRSRAIGVVVCVIAAPLHSYILSSPFLPLHPQSAVFFLRLPLPILEIKASRPSYHFPHQSIHAVTVWLRPRTRPTSPEHVNRSVPLSFTTATCHLFSWSTFVYLSPARLRILECNDYRPTDHWRTVQ